MFKRLAIVVAACLGLSFAIAAEYKKNELDPTYDHDKYLTKPADIVRSFRAYTVSFDGPDDDDGDGKPDLRRTPEWVAYEIKGSKKKFDKGPKRPDEWITDKYLFAAGVAPKDTSYAFGQDFRKDHPESPQLGYDRGHMCMKEIAFRLGKEADWNTHTMLNACPQRAALNEGIWLNLEQKTEKWADKYGDVWIVCGPIYYKDKPIEWLGEQEKAELPVAIPHAFFKIVVKQEKDKKLPDVLAFIYPQKQEDGKDFPHAGPYDHSKFLRSVRDIEDATHLNFMTLLSQEDQDKVETTKATQLWEE